MKRMTASFRHAFRGIGYALRGRNFRIEVVSAAVVIGLGIWLGIGGTDMTLVIFASGFVLALEATNSAIEEVCNKFHPEEHPHIALIKDLAAGAVLISAITAAAIGLIVFHPYLFR
ncbi:MAG: diacylglycerol kinase family protein [Patescibacteria group bacterium]|nr:diacylglycerol kinase family protein [Patescibacteria group bacterium]MDE2116751.1 diacylglycerol kinase family protein [Patescibacteria group bacterium]